MKTRTEMIVKKDRIYCCQCEYNISEVDFNLGKGRLMFNEGLGIKTGEFRCGICDPRCNDPDGILPDDDTNE